MLLSTALFYTLVAIGSTVSSKNGSSAVKNVTGAAHWYPPPFYGAPPIPSFYPPQPGSLPPLLPPPPPPPPQPQPLPLIPPQGVYGQPGFGTPGFVPSGYGPVLPFFSKPPIAETPPFALDHYYCSAQASFALVNGGGAQPFAAIMPFPSTGDSFDGAEVGVLPPEGEVPSNIPLGTTRQFCRYTATLDNHACNYCCKIAARHYTTSIDEVTGLLFSFDPNMPPVLPENAITGASLNRKKRAQATSDSNMQSTANSQTPTAPAEMPSGTNGNGNAPTALGGFQTDTETIPGPQIPPPLPVQTEPSRPSPPFLALPEQPMPRPVLQCFCCAPKKFFSPL